MLERVRGVLGESARMRRGFWTVLSRRLSLHELLESRQQRQVGRKQVLGLELVRNRGSVRDGKATVRFLLKLSHSGEIFRTELSAVG